MIWYQLVGRRRCFCCLLLPPKYDIERIGRVQQGTTLLTVGMCPVVVVVEAFRPRRGTLQVVAANHACSPSRSRTIAACRCTRLFLLLLLLLLHARRCLLGRLCCCFGCFGSSAAGCKTLFEIVVGVVHSVVVVIPFIVQTKAAAQLLLQLCLPKKAAAPVVVVSVPRVDAIIITGTVAVASPFL
jgi:hypothetical protein